MHTMFKQNRKNAIQFLITVCYVYKVFNFHPELKSNIFFFFFSYLYINMRVVIRESVDKTFL